MPAPGARPRCRLHLEPIEVHAARVAEAAELGGVEALGLAARDAAVRGEQRRLARHRTAQPLELGRDPRAEGDVEEADGEEHAAAEHLRPLLDVEGEEARREVDWLGLGLGLGSGSGSGVGLGLGLANPNPGAGRTAAAAGGEAEQRAVPLEAEGEVVAQQRRLDLGRGRGGG